METTMLAKMEVYQQITSIKPKDPFTYQVAIKINGTNILHK
jgi:hypothetical protein